MKWFFCKNRWGIYLIVIVVLLTLFVDSTNPSSLENNDDIFSSNRSSRSLFLSSEIRSFHLMTEGEFCQDHVKYKYPFSCNHPKRVLVIPHNFPVPTLHGSDKRCFHVLEALRALDHTVALIPFSRTYAKPGDDDKALLKELKVQYYPSQLIQHKKNVTLNYLKVLNDFKPDIIITWLWFWEMKFNAPSVLIPLTRQLTPKVKVVLFTDDVHSKRERQIAEQFKNPHAFDHYVRRSKKMLIEEMKVYKDADIVVSISEADRREIASMDGGAVKDKVMKMRYIASPWDNVLNTIRTKSGVQDFNYRNNLVFVGNGENPTNIHAMKWYIESLASELKKGIPGIKLTVIGRSWDAFAMSQPESTEYMLFTGSLSTNDMNDAIDRAKVFISPIRASTGINTKNVLALNRGIPLVTTPAGAVGMCAKCDDAILGNPFDPFDNEKLSTSIEMPLLMGRDVFDIVNQVKSLYYDEKKWREFSTAGVKHVKNWFGLAEAAQELDKVLEATLKLNSAD